MFRNTLTVALMVCGLASSAQIAENVEPMSKFKVRSFNISLNGASDIYNDMSMQWMRDHTKNPADLDFDNTGYIQFNETRVSAGGLGVQLSIVPLHKETMLYNNKHEFQIGLHTTLSREAMVDFSKKEEWADIESEEHVIFCLVDNEVSANLGYVYSMYSGPFRLFAGPRISVGRVVTSDMLRMTHTYFTYYDSDGTIGSTDYVEGDTEFYAAKEARYGRVFGQIGLGVKVFPSLELTGTYLHGLGVEQIKNGATNWMSHTYSFRGGVNWIFGQKRTRTAPSI